MNTLFKGARQYLGIKMPQEVVDVLDVCDVQSQTTPAVDNVIHNNQSHLGIEPAQAVGYFEVQGRGNPIRYAHR